MSEIVEHARIADFSIPLKTFTKSGMNEVQYRMYVKGQIVLISLFCLDTCLQNIEGKKKLLDLTLNLSKFDSGIITTVKSMYLIIQKIAFPEIVTAFARLLHTLNDTPIPRTVLV